MHRRRLAVEEAIAPVAVEAEPAEMHVEGVPEHAEAGDDEHRARRRGRRGGRRRRPDGNGEMPPHAEPGADQPDLPPVYTGPTPANPFGGRTFDIFDVMDQAEAAAPAEVVIAAASEPEPAASVILVEPEPVHIEVLHREPEPAVAIIPAEPELLQVEAAREPEPTLAVISSEPNWLQAEVPQGEPEPAPTVIPAEPVAMHADAPRSEPVSELPEPEPVLAANDAAPAPTIKPIIVGGEQDVVVAKKRGWWRR